MINREASKLFHKQYGYDKNFMTPDLVALDYCLNNDSLIYELSTGTMFYPADKAAGVTIVEVTDTGEVIRRRDLSKCFPNDTLQNVKRDAWEYINSIE